MFYFKNDNILLYFNEWLQPAGACAAG